MKDYSYVIVGLGNPGKEYAATRHNLGFLAMEEVLRAFGNGEKTWEKEPKRKVALGELEIEGQKILLIKPLGFMNKSGEVLKNFFDYRKLSPEKLAGRMVLIQDDADLAEGKIKISLDGGGGGHKGVSSILKAFNQADFWRIKIGMRPQGNNKRSETFVLKKFDKQGVLGEKIKEFPQIIECLIKEGPAKCQTLYN